MLYIYIWSFTTFGALKPEPLGPHNKCCHSLTLSAAAMHIGTFLGCAKYLLLLRFPVLRHFVRTPPYPFLLKGYVSGDGLIHHPPPRAALGRVTASHRWCKGWLEGCFEPKADAIGHDDMGNVFHPSFPSVYLDPARHSPRSTASPLAPVWQKLCSSLLPAS